MRIIGIDPGMAIVGYCIIDINDNENLLITSGSIQTCKTKNESARLLEIYNDISTIIEKYNPEVASIEKLFFFKNAKTVMPVAQARGVILMAIEQFNVPIYEYTPMVVKQVITGYGRATKDEVGRIVEMSIKYEKLPKLDDTIDSIAIALCHARSILNVCPV